MLMQSSKPLLMAPRYCGGAISDRYSGIDCKRILRISMFFIIFCESIISS
jgi:nitrate/nitrite transporter NarK